MGQAGAQKAVGMSSAVMIVMSLLPGIPMLPFLLLGGGAGVLAYMMEKRSAAAVLETKKAEAETKAAPAEEPISASLKIDDLKIELSSSASVPKPADCRNRKSIRARGSRRWGIFERAAFAKFESCAAWAGVSRNLTH
jgi:flagellar biosynthesis component FlhA